MKRYYLFLALLGVASLILVGQQFVTSRDPLSDQIKSDDVTTITTTVDNYAQKNKKLPSSLADLVFTQPLRGKLSDYQYTTLTTNAYQVCADYKTDTTKTTASYSSSTDPSYHAKGYSCVKEQNYSIPTPVVSPPPSLTNQTQIKKVGDACTQSVVSTSTGVFDSTGTDVATKGTYVVYRAYPTAYSKNSNFTCSNVVVTNKAGQTISLGQLAVGDSITVYNDGSFVSKITKNN